MNNLRNLYPERTHQDLKRMMPYANKTYYEFNKNDTNEYRTIYLRFNPFNSKVTPMYSNFIHGTPPSHIEPYNDGLHRAIMRFNSIPDAPFH